MADRLVVIFCHFLNLHCVANSGLITLLLGQLEFFRGFIETFLRVF